MKKRWIATLVLGAQLVAQPAYAWDAVGHEVIARIAWENMTPRTREAAVALLMSAPTDSDLRTLRPVVGPNEIRDRTLFVRASNWADLARSTPRLGRYNHAAWHFINYFFESTPRGPKDRSDLRPDSANIVTSLNRLEVLIRDQRRAAAYRATDLAWILHLVGDIHQPLHTVSRVSALTPSGDQGGNLFPLDGQNNLHAYWDGLISQSGRRTQAETEMQYVDRMAGLIAQRHPRTASGSGGRYDTWARATSQIAKSQAYQTEPGRAPTAAYRQSSMRSAEAAAALAGYRLAEVLNRTIGAEGAR